MWTRCAKLSSKRIILGDFQRRECNGDWSLGFPTVDPSVGGDKGDVGTGGRGGLLLPSGILDLPSLQMQRVRFRGILIQRTWRTHFPALHEGGCGTDGPFLSPFPCFPASDSFAPHEVENLK